MRRPSDHIAAWRGTGSQRRAGQMLPPSARARQSAFPAATTPPS